MPLWDVISGLQKDVKKALGNYALDAAVYVIQHGVPIYAAISDVANNQLFQDIKHIFVEDVVPIAAAGYLNDLTANYLDEQDSPAATTLKMGICGALSVYSFGKQVEFAARTVFLTLDAGNQLRGRKKDTEYEAVCQEAKCTMQRRLQGDWRALFVYFATDMMISQTVPYVGPYFAELLHMYLVGHYVLEEITPMCNRHQVQFMREYPELSLAIGFSHWLMSTSATLAIQELTRAPGQLSEYLLNQYYQNSEGAPFQINTEISAKYYQDQVKVLGLIIEMMIVAHMRLPRPVLEPEIFDVLVKEKKVLVLPLEELGEDDRRKRISVSKSVHPLVVKRDRNIFADPLMAFQSFVGEEFDIHARWIKSRIEPWIKRSSPDAWGKRIDKAAVDAWNHQIWSDPFWQKPGVRLSKKGLAKIEQWLLPEMFYKKGALADDFVIGRSLEAWREELLIRIKLIEEIEYKLRKPIRVAREHPEVKKVLTNAAARFYASRLEIPSEKLILMINVFIKLFSNELLIKRLKQLRVLLEPIIEDLPRENDRLVSMRSSTRARQAKDEIPITGPRIEEISQDERLVESSIAELVATPIKQIQTLPVFTTEVPVSLETNAPIVAVASGVESVPVKCDQDEPAVLLGLQRHSLFRPDSPLERSKVSQSEVEDDLAFLQRSNEADAPPVVKQAGARVDPAPGLGQNSLFRPVKSPPPLARVSRQFSVEDDFEFLERSNGSKRIDSPPPVREATVDSTDSFEPLLGLQVSSPSRKADSLNTP